MAFLELSLVFGAAAAVAWFLVGRWIGISVRARIIDVPSHRSSHSVATPRGGGVGIVASVLLVAAGAVLAGGAASPATAVWVACLAVGIALVSFVDDVRSLPSIVRLGCHVGCATVAVVLLGWFAAITPPLTTTVQLSAGIMIVATVFWIIGLTNVYNFMDGIDGIAGGQGVVAGLAWAFYGYTHEMQLISWCGAGLSGACLGFLRYNWAPAKVFMGDVGSAFLGFVFAVLPLFAVRNEVVGRESNLDEAGTLPVFSALVVFPFLADSSYTLFRRLRRRENVFEAHRSHLYQRLAIAGWSHQRISAIYISWATFSTVLGAAYLVADSAWRGVIVTSALLSAFAALILVKRVEHRTITLATKVEPKAV